MSALLRPPLTTATALPFKFASDFCRFTICDEPKEFDAARFSADIVTCVCPGTLVIGVCSLLRLEALSVHKFYAMRVQER